MPEGMAEAEGGEREKASDLGKITMVIGAVYVQALQGLYHKGIQDRRRGDKNAFAKLSVMGHLLKYLEELNIVRKHKR